MNAPPQMPSVWHVTVLALHTGLAIGALLPLRVRILKELAVQGKIVGLELMTALAELGTLKSWSGGKAAMREHRAWLQGWGVGATWWAKTLMLPHVTGGAHQASLL
jgi:hypothetical protein